MKLKLGKEWVERFVDIPEAGMGHYYVNITLYNGNKICDIPAYFNEEGLPILVVSEFVDPDDILDIDDA